jgi:hypothetical protein
VLCPEHAQMFADAGYSKAAVQEWLIARCGRIPADLRRAGKGDLSKISPEGEARQAAAGAWEISRTMQSPQQLPVIVAGARNAAISMVVRIFGEWSGTAIPVEVPAGARAAGGTGTR